ncbi:MAG: peptidoglycan DD-metalloendopeptidase family protein [Desulfobulbaceae bacterium]|nr:peptidoglycan DD-metalloendopeptidase family protein [Desulfobulbaceae bacterium]
MAFCSSSLRFSPFGFVNKTSGIVTLALSFACPMLVMAQQTPLSSSSSQLNLVQKQIESHREMIEESKIKALNLEQELNRIASEIEKGQETLRDLNVNLHRLEGVIETKEAETTKIQRQKESIADHVKKRLAAFYQTGEVGIINALFSASNLGELLNLQEYVQALFRYDQKVLQGYREQIRMLDKAKGDLTGAKEELQGLIGQMQAGEAALIKSRSERDALLAQARAEQELYRQALKELESAAGKLVKTINNARALEIKNSKQKKTAFQSKIITSSSLTTKFSAHRGKILPPAPGQIIRVFGLYKDQFGNELHADGIDLALPAQTDVVAMHAGRIIYADEMPGYGKLVIIDHGEQYYSLVSGLASLDIKKDDEVNTGDIIGIFGEPTGLVNPGLHVEIRHGSTPVDPLLWLDSKQMESTKTQAANEQ